jgi:hypothetical protein
MASDGSGRHRQAANGTARAGAAEDGVTGTRSGAHRPVARSRRRSRQPVRRVRSVRFGLTDDEYGEVGEAAAQAGMAKGHTRLMRPWQRRGG